MATRWRDIVGQTPTLGPDDRQGAAQFVARIQRAIDMGGWSRSEWGALYRIRDKWRRRAEGRDVRYIVAGNEQRGLTVAEQMKIQTLALTLNDNDGGDKVHGNKSTGRVENAKTTRTANTTAKAGESNTGDATERCPIVREHVNRPGFGWGGRKYKRIG